MSVFVVFCSSFRKVRSHIRRINYRKFIRNLTFDADMKTTAGFVKEDSS